MQKIQSKKYRNWVRGALGLGYLQEGLFPFTDRVVKAEHAKLVQNLTPCTSCSIKNILPKHVSDKVCIQKNKERCNCRNKTNRNCPTCSKIYDDIVLQHRFNDPLWVPDCSTWYNDHWQFAKCFLTTTTKGSNKTAKETDASGLLSIIINGEFFKSKLDCTIDPPNDIFSQVRTMRNKILHNSTLNLDDHDVTSDLESMIAVLEDKTVLGSDPTAQEAVIKLKEILNTDLHITTDEEAKAIQTALNAINEAKEQSEESIRKVTEKELEKATKTIDAEKKQATESVSSKISKVFVEQYEPDLEIFKTKLEDHEARISRNEVELDNMKQRVAELEDVKKKHQTRMTYLNQMKELQKHLVDQYERHNVKTWISPLMTTDNDVNISDVYVPPSMVVKENKDDKDGNTTGPGEDRRTNEKHIKDYRDLFGKEEKQNQKIFIVGDVGTGKSSFSKMMMQNWCSSIKQRRNKSQSHESSAMEGEIIKGNDIYAMDRFDFLFYIPLREKRGGTDDIVNMIKGQLKKSGFNQLQKTYQALINDIFTDDSGRVLIIADGLDEWKPSKSKIGNGLPDFSQANDSTKLTTSRPSSRGILNMKSSDYDLKVTLLGLMQTSVQSMIEKYMKLMNKTSGVADFNNKLRELPFEEIHKAPMLLQQIISLYCNNHEIGQSRSLIYLHIINTVLAWGDDKMQIHPKIKCRKLNQENLQLPKSFDEYTRCQENKDFLCLLGKIAYGAYIKGDDSSLVFGRYKLKQRFDLTDKDIDAIVHTGILTEFICADPTYENKRLSFIHTSYVEYFAALYICSRYPSKLSDAGPSETSLAILENLISVTTETSINEIRRLENVLILICGLVPGLTRDVCECIYNLPPKGENMDENIKDQIQNLTFNCISEHNCFDQENIDKVHCKLRHISPIRISSWWSMCFSNVDPTSIETCRLVHTELTHEQILSLSLFLSQAVSLRTLKMHYSQCYKYQCEGHTIDFTENKKLESIELLHGSISVSGINHTCLQSCRISYCDFTHEQYSLLASRLSDAVDLQTLYIDNIKCKTENHEGHTIDLQNHRGLQNACEGHYINITSHKHLQYLSISECNMITVNGINPTAKWRCSINSCDLSHKQCASLCTSLSKAESLHEIEFENIKCTEDACEGHYIDLANHKLLEKLSISDCNMIYINGINPTCCGQCVINRCNLSHEQCSSLCTSLSQAESFQHIKLSHFKCTKDACEGHTTDLTNHKQLRILSITECNMISITGINPIWGGQCDISNCNISHEQWSSLCTSLSQAESIQRIKLNQIKCTRSACEGHSIDLKNHKQLESLSISNCNKIYVTGKNPNWCGLCDISNCDLSHEQCASLCTSLLQAESLCRINLSQIKCTKDACEGHYIDISNHKQLESLSISDCNMIYITGINPIWCGQCDISNCNLSHEQCSSLCTSLSKAESIQKIKLSQIKCTEDACEGHDINISNHKQLEVFSISKCNIISITGSNPIWLGQCDINRCNISHEQCSSLCTSLSKAESIQEIKFSHIKCSRDACEGHSIDLTNHKQLKVLSISYCNMISINGINPNWNGLCCICNCNLSHKQCASLCTFLSEADSLPDIKLSLIKCSKDACEGHCINLTNYKQLRNLSISNCNMIFITGINPTWCGQCDINICNLSHEQFSSLCTSLSQAESIQQIKQSEIKCTKNVCEGHYIDLSNHKKLEDLSISNCNKLSITGINPTWCGQCDISDCNLSHKLYASLCEFLSLAESLKKIKLSQIRYSDDACEGHYIDLTNHKQLEKLSLSNCNMISISGTNPTLRTLCKISNCNLLHEQCASLCTFISQSKFEFIMLTAIKCTQDKCDGHFIDNRKCYIDKCANISKRKSTS